MRNKVLNILEFWKAVESLSPQRCDKIDKGKGDKKINLDNKRVSKDHLLPWELPKKEKTESNICYRLECGLYKISDLANLVEYKLGRKHNVFDDGRDSSISRLFDIECDEKGYPIPDTFVLSLAAWSAGQIIKYGIEVLKEGGRVDLSELPSASDDIPSPGIGYKGFDELCRAIIQYLRNEVEECEKEKDNCGKFNRNWWKNFIEKIRDLLYLNVNAVEFNEDIGKYEEKNYKVISNEVIVRPIYKTNKTKESEVNNNTNLEQGMLNSFFIRDLTKVINAIKNTRDGIGKALFEYLTSAEEINENEKIDVRENVEYTLRKLHPELVPIGRWPSNYPLVYSQQLAVNLLWKRLFNSEGLFAINGPPGTGKTTLLRDVIAAIITERANLLIKLGDKVFLQEQRISVKDESYSYYPLNNALRATSIVVASSNNGAVENISLELPTKDAVPERVYKNISVDYFSEIATALLQRESWALIAARLGRKNNRLEFLKYFWWGEKENSTHSKKKQVNTIRDILIKAKERKKVLHYKWKELVEKWNQLLEKERNIRAYLQRFANTFYNELNIRNKIKELERNIKNLEKIKNQEEEKYKCMKIELKKLKEELSLAKNVKEKYEKRLENHLKAKPNFLESILTFGRAIKNWRTSYEKLLEEYTAKEEYYNKIHLLVLEKEKELEAIAKKINELNSMFENYNKEMEKLIEELELLDEAVQKLGEYFPNPNASVEEREKSSPWMIKEWRDIREELFLTALEIHRTFIELHAEKFLKNLKISVDWLNGQHFPTDIAQLALDSLCLVVPVISTTFASVASMFKDLGVGSIGWLLIDEAGQALPQHAVGAIWRAKRVVVVGDPKQLEPVSSIYPTVEASLAKIYGDIKEVWWSSKASVQTLADASMDVGTYLPGIEIDEKIWAGCPLRVHRRCSNPMFEISNEIAYNGLMVYGKIPKDYPLPPTVWIDVKSNPSAGRNWIKEEGETLEKFLKFLREKYGKEVLKDIFLISPFRDCARELKRIAKKYGLDENKVGTVHTTQGKESNVVILVCGGSTPGARAWAASKPNLLNVAVTRAKERLYVIGNAEAWKKLNYFNVLCKKLNIKPLDKVIE